MTDLRALREKVKSETATYDDVTELLSACFEAAIDGTISRRDLIDAIDEAARADERNLAKHPEQRGAPAAVFSLQVCQRCESRPAVYRATSDILHMVICRVCAMEAREHCGPGPGAITLIPLAG